ncbi:MAG: hypothetical protein H7Z43_01820, partial [Clostridia bacterium]|nr:hypothetical protein [Deltaproteobacteria bacterium]
MALRISLGENTPENLLHDRTSEIEQKHENTFDRFANKAASPDRHQSTKLLGINTGRFGQGINKMHFDPPSEVEALRRPL